MLLLIKQGREGRLSQSAAGWKAGMQSSLAAGTTKMASIVARARVNCEPVPSRDRVLGRLSLRRIGKILSVRKPSTTRIFSMEATHGSPICRESSFLSCRCSRSSQPAWPPTSVVGHSRAGVLRHHVWRERLRRHCAMGTRPRHPAHAPTWLHTQTSKNGGIRKVLIALNPRAFEDALNRWTRSEERRVGKECVP